MMNKVMNPVNLPVNFHPGAQNAGARSNWSSHNDEHSILSEKMLMDLGKMLGRQFTIYAEALKASLAEEANIPLNDFKALEYIMEFDALPTGQLAHLMDLSASGVSALINRLEHRGYITRGRHPLDKRVIALHPVMDKCREVLAVKERAINQAINTAANQNPAQLIAMYDFLVDSMSTFRQNTKAWLDAKALVPRSS
ncbi:MarR family winged helix-turn-helix transcriptional regulator [Alcaligenes faecalis]|uniref:MarR family winged helix-turn-helix transcriptional regulator n=1 Tax=Alcaligenes faecalis TaxID=511 RepID=UPI001D8A058F|nr:MarR family transcriptional regulator [Alcaligenes faecalis]HJE62445.1 MarR family transcriptional regulator [Alcaligenes faecalis]